MHAVTDSGAHPQLYPQPRIAVGLALLRRRLATAAIDLSDGLSTDLAHLCRESGVGAELSLAALPIHPLALLAGTEQAIDLALNGGEDYELLFAAPAAVKMPRSVAGVRVTRIGKLVRGRDRLAGGFCRATAAAPAGRLGTHRVVQSIPAIAFIIGPSLCMTRPRSFVPR